MWFVFTVDGCIVGGRWLLARGSLDTYGATAGSWKRRLPYMFILVAVDLDDTDVLLAALAGRGSAGD